MRISINLTPALKEVICAFQGPDSLPKMCNISIANGVSCRDSLKRNKSNTVVSGDIVSINLDDVISDADEGRRFCYILTAKAGREEVVLQNTIFVDIIEIGNNDGNNDSQTIAAILVPIVILIMVLAILGVILLFLVSLVYESMQ